MEVPTGMQASRLPTNRIPAPDRTDIHINADSKSNKKYYRGPRINDTLVEWQGSELGD